MPGPAATRPRETYHLLVCTDAPGSDAPREREMQGHLRFIERHIERIALAGPRTDGKQPIDGSIFVIRADSEEDARALLMHDPYFQAGVWERIDIHPFRAVCGRLIGGTTW